MIKGIGNLYFSTLLIFFEFFFFFIFSKGKILAKPNTLFATFLLLLFLLSTLVSIIFDSDLIRMQMVFSIIHVQIIFVFILMYYFLDRVSIKYILNFFLVVVFIASLRLIIEESHRLFSFSTRWGERLEGHFIGAINNFALIMGIALIVSFFYIKNRFLKTTLTIYWLIFIVLTLSRGALMGVVITFFIVAIYDKDRKTLKRLVKLSLSLLFLGLIAILYFDKVDFVVDQFNDRFLSFFTGEKNIEQFSSGRGIIWNDIFFNHFFNSSLFEYLFGHGVGSIDFHTAQYNIKYESSHNILIDILYRNGIFFFVVYLLIVTKIALQFINNRQKSKLTIFGIFVFLHFELFVNPFVYTVQTGWLYTLFLAIFIKQDHLKNLSKIKESDTINEEKSS